MRVIGRALSMLLLGAALLGLGCKDVASAPTGLTYATNPAIYTIGVAIPSNSPTHSGGAIDSYAVSPALPAGLALDAKSGAITGTPTVPSAATAYIVTGTNGAGSTTVSLTITVNDTAITITTQPADQSVVEGQTATFTVAVSSAGTLSYQWSKGGVLIPSATSASYTTPATVLADSGTTYSVDISNSLGGHATSKNATLTVTAAAGPGTFTATTGGLFTRRSYPTSTLLPNGQVLVVGGYSVSLQALHTAELYDPVADTFSPVTATLADVREFHTATLLPNGKVLIAGGDSPAGPINTAELFDPVTATFTSTGNLAAARADHTATLLPNGKVLIVGGRTGTGTTYLSTAELYDPSTGTFTTTTNAPKITARQAHTATLLATGQVLLAGGYFKTTNLSSAELYDPVAGTFTLTGSMAALRNGHTATLLASGKVLMVGGVAVTTAELYDPTSGTFSATTGALQDRRDSGHAAALLPTGKVLICGGKGGTTVLSSAELFDPAAGTFTFTGSMTTVREAHWAVTLGGGKVLVGGGSTGTTTLGSAELYH